MKNKHIALITGASRGIGFSIAKALAEKNVFVIGTATTLIGVEKIDVLLNPHNGIGMLFNINQVEDFEFLINDIIKKYGTLHILVNNAGITRDNLAIRMKDAEWNEVINTNLNGVFKLIRCVLKPMIKNKYGRIVNITSVIESIGNAGQVNYAASKAAVTGMSRTLAKEIGSRGITINCISPGFIDTDMTKNFSVNQKNMLKGSIPVGRFGKPEDIANAVVFLTAETTSYITGTTLHVNGGLYLN